MRKTLLSCFALNLTMIASVALAAPTTESIPNSTRLTESQMDTVTAGFGSITVFSSARASGPGSTSAYAAVAIYGDSAKVFLDDGPSVFCYSLHTDPKPVIGMDNDSIRFPRPFFHF